MKAKGAPSTDRDMDCAAESEKVNPDSCSNDENDGNACARVESKTILDLDGGAEVEDEEREMCVEREEEEDDGETEDKIEGNDRSSFMAADGDSNSGDLCVEKNGSSSGAVSTTTLTNNDVWSAYVRLNKNARKLTQYLMTLPTAPAPGSVNEQSLNSSLLRFVKKILDLKKSGNRPRSKSFLDEFLATPFQYPALDPSKKTKRGNPRAIEASLDSEENLLLAHATIDAELAKWAEGVERGFAQRGTEETKDCDRIETGVKQMRKELKELREQVARQKRKYDNVVVELAADEASASKTQAEYRDCQQDLKKDKRRPIRAEETAEIEETIEKIDREKLDFHLENDELERMNQELRGSLSELIDRRFYCRVDERPNAKLKPETKKMIGDLLRLGIPKEGVNVVVERILGLCDFRLGSKPSAEEIDQIDAEDADEFT